MRRALAALVLLATGAASAQAFRASFTVHGHSEAMASEEKPVESDNPPQISPDEDGTLNFVLGPSRLLMEQGDRRFFDFDAGVLRVLAPDGKSYDEVPLLGVADASSAELYNRSFMGGAMRAGDIKGPQVRSCDPFELACLFSLDPPPLKGEAAPPVPTLDETPTGFTLSHGGETVVSVTWSKVRVPEALRPTWKRALQHRLRVHPVVRRRLGQAEFLPAEISTRTLQMFQLTRESWTLGETGEADAASLELPADAVRQLGVPDALRDALEVARKAVAVPPTDAASALDKFATEAVAAGRVLDAGLAALEENFVSGSGGQAALASHKDAFSADPAFRTLVTSVDMSSKEACERSLKGLSGLDRTGLQKGWVLDIFLGNVRLALDQIDEGRALLLGALGHNARMVGVWHDLGDSYVSEWDLVDGWRCWSTALALRHDHPMLKQVREREATLRKQGPDFF